MMNIIKDVGLEQASFFMGLGLRGYALVALLLWVLLGAAREQWERRRHVRVLRNRCSTLALSESILVVVRAYKDSDIGWTLFSIFDRAYCPYRVYIGVMEDENTESLELFEAISAHQRSLVDHVRTAKHDFSTRWDKAGLEAHCQNEQFALCMTSDTLLETHWDARLLRHASGDPTAAWSAVPPHAPYRYPHLHRGRAVSVMAAAAGRGGSARSENKEAGHFVRMTGLEMPWAGPRLALTPCVLAQPVPTLLWTSRFGFCRVDVLRRALQRVPVERTSDILDDCLLTGAFVSENVRILLPPHVCATTLTPLPPVPSETFRPTKIHRDLARAFHAHTNVRLGAPPYVGQRAHLGLGPSPSTEEIMIKYGSHTKYQRAHARLRKILLGREK